jgi:hypothetical protein
MGIYEKVIETLEEAEHSDDHNHNKERWFGKISGNNEVNAIENSFTPFRITSGVGTYGTAVCILGSSDVPVQGKTYFDIHRLLCVNFQKGEIAKIRMAWGTGTHADAITAGNYSTIIVNPMTTSKEADFEIKCPIIANSTKVWISFWSTTNSQYVDLFFGIHGYS